MPRAIEHDHEFRDQGLVVVLMECQGTPQEGLEPFIWKNFAKCQARVCVSQTAAFPQFDGLPTTALVGVDGTLLFMDHPQEKKLKELMTAELDKIKKGWGDSPDTRKVRALIFGKHDYAGAKKLIDGLTDQAQQDLLKKELDRAYSRDLEAAKFLQAQTQLTQSHDRLMELQKSVTGVAEWQQTVNTQLASLDTPEAKKDLAADKKLEKLLETYHDGKLKPDIFSKNLQAVAKSVQGTGVAPRAGKLVEVAKAAEALPLSR